MPTPAWFDEIPVLGALPDDQIVDRLRFVGEPSLADKLELALLSYSTEPAHTFSIKGRQMLARHPWSHTGHVCGYLEPPKSLGEMLPILSTQGLEADRTLLGERLTVGLDGFQPADYPGGEVHRVLFHFAANHHLDELERLHFNATRHVEEGQPFLYLDQPIFVGLKAGEPGLDFRYLTLKVIDACDRAFLETLALDVLQLGLRLSELPRPAADLASDLAFQLTGKIRRGQPAIQEFRLGLDFAAHERSAPLRTGTYIAAQVPTAEQLLWDWEQWRYHPLSGQIVSREDPDNRFPFNYLLITVDRLTPRSSPGRTRVLAAATDAPQDVLQEDPVSIASPVRSPASPCEGRDRPPTGSPPDLTIRVRVEKSSAGQRLHYTLHSESGRVDLNHQDFAGPRFETSPRKFQADLLDRIKELHRGYDSYEEALLSEEIVQRLESFGQNLYRDLFPPEIRQLYRAIRDEVCSIQIVSDEPWIPWELVKPYDGQKPVIDDDFLCLRYELTRWLAGGRVPVGRIRVDRLAAVQAGHVPGLDSLTTADKELELVTEMAKNRSSLEDKSLDRATHDGLRRLLETGKANLIHVIAHGDLDPEHPDDARIILTDKRTFRSSDLTGNLATGVYESRPLVFLNSCLLGQQGYSLTGLGGWAQAFLSAGCGAFLGQQWSVRDSLSFEMTRLFYSELKEGKTFGQAARSARLRARFLMPSSPTWSALTVYAHPNGRLFWGGFDSTDGNG